MAAEPTHLPVDVRVHQITHRGTRGAMSVIDAVMTRYRSSEFLGRAQLVHALERRVQQRGFVTTIRSGAVYADETHAVLRVSYRTERGTSGRP